MSNFNSIKAYDFSAKYIGDHGQPQIDKITITTQSPNKILGSGPVYGGYKDHESHFLAAAKAATLDKTLIQSAKFNHYKFAVHICLDSTSHRALLMMGPKNPEKNPFARLEFNPAKLGYEGMAELYANLSSFIDTGGEWFWDNGNVSKIDVAIDLHDVSVGQLRFLNKWGTTTRLIGVDGNFDTIYVGKSTSRQTKIYDKAKLAKLPDDLIVTRVERSLKPQKPLKELLSLKNPFLHLSVVEKVPSAPDFIDAKLWELLTDSLVQRGPAAMFKQVPEAKAKLLAAHFENNPQDCWQPKLFWQQWPNAVSPLLDAFKTIPYFKKSA